MAIVQFSQPKGAFFSSLRQAVDDYFAKNQLEPTGNFQLYSKAATLIALYIVFYVGMFAPIATPLKLVSAALLGFVQALVGFNIMHDACHDAFSNKKSVNYWFGLSMNALGSDAFMWRQKHNLIHHTYTNVDGMDDDIAKTPLLRMCETQPRYSAHRFQHIYMPFLYAISTLYWIVVKDFQIYFGGYHYNMPLAKMKALDHFVFWFSRILYFFMYFFLPVYFSGWGIGITQFVLMHVFLGLTMSLVFQLAHVVDNVSFEHLDSDKLTLENEWAVHQIATTSDFAVDNKVVSWFLGGLNYQAVHHLFPRVSHVHYPALQKIIAKTCEEHGVTYHSFPTTIDALKSHFRHMRRLGMQ